MAVTRTGRWTFKLGDFRKSAHMSPGFVSNGHWIIKRGALENEAAYRTEDGARALLKGAVSHVVRAYDSDDMLGRVWLKPDTPTEAYRVTPFVRSGRDGSAWRILVGAPGPHGDGLAEIDDTYCDVFGVKVGDTLHTPVPLAGPRGRGVFYNAADGDMAAWGLMSGRGADVLPDMLAELTAATVPATVTTPDDGTQVLEVVPDGVPEGGDDASDEA